MKTLTANQLALYLGCEAQTKFRKISNPRTIVTEVKTLTAAIIAMDNLVYTSIKPILRPLSDITEEECKGIGSIISYLMPNGFDIDASPYTITFDSNDGDGMYLTLYVKNGSMDCLCKDNGEYYPYPSAEINAYLLSRGFDLFNWIEQGLALGKPAKVDSSEKPTGAAEDL